MLELLGWAAQNLALAPWYVIQAMAQPLAWLDWGERQSLARFIYFGASSQLFFVYLFSFFLLIGLSLWRNYILWGVVSSLEGIGNGIGRIAAWAGLLMVLQQIMIVFLQRYFGVSSIELGPLGFAFSRDLSWWAEELRLYNALIVTLCVAYTFTQGGHVRVDLIYAAVGFRTKKIIDMIGSVLFMIPLGTMLWLYGWFYMWQALIVPNPNASASLDRLMAQSRAMRWNVETTGFSGAGFDAYFIFKILVVIFAGLILMQSVAFFLRSLGEFLEGESAEGRNLDKDKDQAESITASDQHAVKSNHNN